MDRHLLWTAAKHPLYKIAYWVPHLDEDLGDASPFLAYGSGILSTANVFRWVSSQPLDMRELFADRKALAQCRLGGITSPLIIPIQLSSFIELSGNSTTPFNCVISSAESHDPIAAMVRNSAVPWLHLDVAGTAGTLSLNAVDDEVYARFIADVINALPVASARKWFGEFVGEPIRQLEALKSDLPKFHHNLTSPNEAALQALKVRRDGDEQPLAANQDEVLVRAIVKSKRAVDAALRASLGSQNASSCIGAISVALDSHVWHIFRAYLPELLAKQGLSGEERKVVAKIVKRNAFGVVVHAEDESFERLMASDPIRETLETRGREMAAFTAGLHVHSTTRLTPVVRLNPATNGIRSRLVALGGCARGNGPHRDFKINKIAREALSEAAVAIGSATLREIAGASDEISAVNLICDLPLEWLRIDGVPLGMRSDTSRIPATPGNLSFAECVRGSEALVALKDLQSILVIRSFQEGDPIAQVLERALTLAHGGAEGTDSEGPKCVFVDVSTASEFRDALNAFDGAMMIFDGHGFMSTQHGAGSIVVGGQAIDVWDLRKQVRCPPIVLLSACDTYPVDGSHASSAQGMLHLGAATVLGTLLPINALKSAVFLRRLMFRIAKLVPMLVEAKPEGVDWRTVMSGMLRMAYATEVIRDFCAWRRIPYKEAMEIGEWVNRDINYRHPKWHGRMLNRLASLGRIPIRDVRAWLETYAYLTDAMKYVQLGRPELVRIVRDKSAPVGS